MLSRHLCNATFSTIAAVALVIVLALGLLPALAQEINGCNDSSWYYTFTDGHDGALPTSLTADQAGNIFGTTAVGTIFKFANDQVTRLYQFKGGTDGNQSSPLVVGYQGGLYGYSDGGLENCNGPYGSDCGQVFVLTPPPPKFCTPGMCQYKKTTIYQFTGESDAFSPNAMIGDAAGNLYGTSPYGGAGACNNGQYSGCGTVFEISPSGGSWKETILYSFTGAGDGNNPNSLFLGSDGNLYGSAAGGYSGWGVIFRLSPSGSGWTETVLHNFQHKDNASLAFSVVQDGQGDLYGAVNNGSDIFRLSFAGGVWTYNQVYALQYYNQGVVEQLLPGQVGGIAISAGPACDGLACFDAGYYGKLLGFYSGGGGSLHTFYCWSPHYMTYGPAGHPYGNVWGTSPGGGYSQYGTIWRY